MPRYAAFLRGINVGGHRVKGADLCPPLEALGLAPVRTFRASGNVFFEASPGEAHEKEISAALEAALGYEVLTFLRTEKELRAIAGHEPFGKARTKGSNGKLQVSMLPTRASPKARATVMALATDADLLAFGSRELFWLPRGGTQESDLDLKAIDAAIGPSTMRTMGTLQQMLAKFFDG